jgi:heat shock protein HtpX
MRRPRVELPRDWGLDLRMLLTVAVAALILLGSLALCVWAAFFTEKGYSIVLILLFMIGVGWAMTRPGGVTRPPGSRIVEPADMERVQASLARLALVADVTPPSIRVEPALAPLSWTTAARPSKARIHVTTGLLDRLGEAELEAVLAHELGHIIHRDAVVMSVFGTIPEWVLRGVAMATSDVRSLVFAIFPGMLFAPPAAVVFVLSRSLSRHREFTADRTAALLTGSPSAVGAALVAVDERLRGLSRRDLRTAAVGDSLLFVPARAPRKWSRILATHPSVEQRMRALEEIEETLNRRV